MPRHDVASAHAPAHAHATTAVRSHAHNHSRAADYEANLVRLNRELVAALQELMDALEKTPSQSARELETVLAIQNNLMHLCNMLRPVQARATLKHALRQAVQQKQAILSKLAESRQGVHDASAAAVTSLGAGA